MAQVSLGIVCVWQRNCELPATVPSLSVPHTCSLIVLPTLDTLHMRINLMLGLTMMSVALYPYMGPSGPIPPLLPKILPLRFPIGPTNKSQTCPLENFPLVTMFCHPKNNT